MHTDLIRRMYRGVIRFRRKTERYITDHIQITDEDIQYYEMIGRMIPEVSMYKKETIRYVKRHALFRGCFSIRAYYRYLVRHASEVQYLRNNLTLTGTHFFRGDDWDDFGRICASELAGKDQLKIWCAGCSNGKEVYSLIMTFLDFKRPEQLDVLATDYKDDLLAECRRGVYSISAQTESPDKYLKYVDIGKKLTISPDLTQLVHTRNINLLTDPYPAGFDVIICRNVIKFFTPEMREEVQQRFTQSLCIGGILFLSDDDHDSRHLELIREPEAIGLTVSDNKCIYKRIG